MTTIVDHEVLEVWRQREDARGADRIGFIGRGVRVYTTWQKVGGAGSQLLKTTVTVVRFGKEWFEVLDPVIDGKRERYRRIVVSHHYKAPLNLLLTDPRARGPREAQ